MKNKLILKYSILGFFFISIVGTLSHFVYDWLGNNIVICAFFSVNESSWEHLKLAVIPGFIWLFIEYIYLDKKNNFFKAKLFSFVTMIVLILSLFYGYKLIFKEEILLLDVIIFYLSIGIGQFVSYVIMKYNKINKHTENIYIVLLLGMILSFVIFTFYPPKIDIFKDHNTNSYGITSYN